MQKLDDEFKMFLEKEQTTRNYDYVVNNLRPETVLMIRTIVLLRYFVAMNKFKFAHNPYDFKDVIEQYTKGNTDVLLKIKEIKRKLDYTLGYVTGNTTSLQSIETRRRPSLFRQNTHFDLLPTEENNIASLENRIDTIENKLDRLIELFNKQYENKENDVFDENKE